MQKILPLTILLSICFTSCLTIVESYQFNKDGSGSMRFTIDMGEMEAILAYADLEQNESSLEDLSFVEVVKSLKQIDGIYEVALLDEPQAYRWGVQYEFAHTTALNKALRLLLLKEPFTTSPSFVSFNGHQFEGKHQFNKFELSEKLLEDERLAPIAEELQKRMEYHIHYQFTRPIKVVYANQEVELLGRNPKILQLESSFWDLGKNPQILDATLILK